MRIRLDLGYDGTGFSGWARQPGLRTVQSVLESTIAQTLRLDHDPVTVCAGRTDAGVHARGQVCHVDLPNTIAGAQDNEIPVDQALNQRLSRALPEDIAIHGIMVAPDGFDARFSAVYRRYAYRLVDRPTAVDPLQRSFVVNYPHQVDVESMASASSGLLGLHDFAAFCRPKSGGTTIRTLLELSVKRHADELIEFTVVADSFCHSMVRSLVGALVCLGRGQRDQVWLDAQLAAKQRANDIIVMPAHGLTLEEVCYPPADQLVSRATQARARRNECELG